MEIYTVETGDNIDEIAARFQVNVSDLIYDNQLVYPYRLAVGPVSYTHLDIDDVIGILHMRDAMVYREKQVHEETAIEDIEGLLRPAHFIPESRNVSDLFQEMQAEKIHMEIVVDEYGQTSGIITMEDILEEIVGNILDEYDEEEEYIRENGDGTFIIKGMAPLDQVEAALKTTLSDCLLYTSLSYRVSNMQDQKNGVQKKL